MAKTSPSESSESSGFRVTPLAFLGVEMSLNESWKLFWIKYSAKFFHVKLRFTPEKSSQKAVYEER